MRTAWSSAMPRRIVSCGVHIAHRGYIRIREPFEAAGMSNRLTASTGATALFAVLALARSASVGPAVQGEAATDPHDWPVYGGNAAGTRYSALDQINRGN